MRTCPGYAILTCTDFEGRIWQNDLWPEGSEKTIQTLHIRRTVIRLPPAGRNWIFPCPYKKKEVRRPAVKAVVEPQIRQERPPQTQAPRVSAPQVSAPQIQIPQVQAPQIQTPQIQAKPAAARKPAPDQKAADRREAEEMRKRRMQAHAWQIQQEEEARERAAQAAEVRRLEEEQQRLRAQAAERRKSAAEEKRRKEEEEARIAAEVERRLEAAKAEAVPQVIMSPKVQKAKRKTIFAVVAGVLLIGVISVVLGIRYDRMRQERDEARQDLEWYRSLVSGGDAEEVEMGTGGSGAEEAVIAGDGIRRVYLTFDDGPSEVTFQILDILKTYNVKATFFVLGRDDERSVECYNRIVDEGHTLAMHSFDHDFSRLYASLDSFSADTLRLRNFLFERTDGRVWCDYYRFPGGSSTTTAQADMKDLIAYLAREGIVYYDWNIYGGDDIAADVIVSNVTSNIARHDNAVVLMHDAADKTETVEALPRIIEYIQGLDHTVLLPITEETVPVQHGDTP